MFYAFEFLLVELFGITFCSLHCSSHFYVFVGWFHASVLELGLHVQLDLLRPGVPNQHLPALVSLRFELRYLYQVFQELSFLVADSNL